MQQPAAALKARVETLGLLSESASAWTNLMFAGSTGIASPAGTTVDVVSNAHSITSPVGLGTLSVFTSSQVRDSWTGALPTGAEVLGRVGGAAYLTAFLKGAALFPSNVAAGRRVLFGTASSTPSAWNGSLKLLMARSLAYASCSATTAVTLMSFEAAPSDGAVDLAGGRDRSCTTSVSTSTGAPRRRVRGRASTRR